MFESDRYEFILPFFIIDLLVGQPTLGLPVYFSTDVPHVQWEIPQTREEGSVFIQVMAFLFLVSPE